MPDVGKGLMLGGCGMMLAGCLLIILIPVVLIGCIAIMGSIGDTDGTAIEGRNMGANSGGDTTSVRTVPEGVEQVGGENP